MKVKELIKALEKKPQDAEVCYPVNDDELREVAGIKTAINNYDELKEFLGDEFVIIE